MNSNDPQQSSPLADERILEAVRKQHRWLRALAALVVAFWILAVLGGVGVLVFYNIFYAPKEKQMFMEYETYGHLQDRPQKTTPEMDGKHAAMASDKALSLHFTMNYMITKSLLVVAVTLIVLSCGTLTTLLLVLLNRRVTLKQINYSLAQISEQLKQLQARPTG